MVLKCLGLDFFVQFKTLSQRLEKIDVDVFRSLDPLKSLHSERSSFFRDCLVEWRVHRLLLVLFSLFVMSFWSDLKAIHCNL